MRRATRSLPESPSQAHKQSGKPVRMGGCQGPPSFEVTMPLYKSRYTDFQVLVRGESINYHPATGVEIGRTRRLTANFGIHGTPFTETNPLTGELEEHVQITGHFYDSEEAKERLGWTDDEHDSVVYALDKLCREQP